MASNALPPYLVAGVGNVLMGNDGFGPLAVAHLEAEWDIPDTVEIADLGTPGLDLTHRLLGRSAVIFLDALAGGGSAGEVRVLDRETLLSAPQHLRTGPHDPSVVDALRVAAMEGGAPADVYLVGPLVTSADLGTDVDPEIRAAVPVALGRVVGLLGDLGVECRRAEPPRRLRRWQDLPE